jgi:hypothetical protein
MTDFGTRSVVCWENTDKWNTMSTYDLQNEEIRDELIARYRGQYRLLRDIGVPPMHVKWSVVSCASSVELGMVDDRVHHSMVASRAATGEFALVIFGGLTGSGELAGDTYRIVQQEVRWNFEVVHSEQNPTPRYHSAMVETPSGIFLFGGTTNGTDKMDDFWRLTSAGWEEVSAGGERPPPGFGLHLSYFPDDTILLTGGFVEFSFYKYSISANAWTKVPPKRTCVLPPYIGHQVFPTGDGSGFIVNGHTLTGDCSDAVIQFTDWGCCNFTFILCRGMSPIGRVWGSSALVGNLLAVIGGERESELYLLDLTDQVWHYSKARSLDQPGLYGAACAVSENRLYIHGGCDDTSAVQATLFEGELEGQSPISTFGAKFEDDMWRREAVCQADEDEPEAWIEVPDLG